MSTFIAMNPGGGKARRAGKGTLLIGSTPAPFSTSIEVFPVRWPPYTSGSPNFNDPAGTKYWLRLDHRETTTMPLVAAHGWNVKRWSLHFTGTVGFRWGAETFAVDITSLFYIQDPSDDVILAPNRVAEPGEAFVGTTSLPTDGMQYLGTIKDYNGADRENLYLAIMPTVTMERFIYHLGDYVYAPAEFSAVVQLVESDGDSGFELVHIRDDVEGSLEIVAEESCGITSFWRPTLASTKKSAVGNLYVLDFDGEQYGTTDLSSTTSVLAADAYTSFSSLDLTVELRQATLHGARLGI